MATYLSSFLVVLVLIIDPTTATLLNGIQLPLVNALSLSGRLVCNININTSTSVVQGIAGVTVYVRCNGKNTSLGQVKTGAGGFIAVIFATLDGAAFDPSNCEAFVPLPVGNCTAYPPTGTLYSVLTFLSFIQTIQQGLVAIVKLTGFNVLP
ncbi:hypothetical protein ACFE04_030072 [Oxalis oulophora]